MADTIPAMLEPGEYVLNRNAVKAIGKNKLDELNFEEAPRDLLSMTQGGDYTIPAGKNIFGQPTEEMGMEELLEMITHGGGAAGVLKKGVGATKSTGNWAAKLLSKKRAKEVLPIAEEEGKKSMKRFVDSVRLGEIRPTESNMSDVFAHRDYTNFLKEYIKKGASYFPVDLVRQQRKQRGGSIDDFSLMDYMMPSMEKRLGPPLKKFQSGGSVPQPGDPYYYQYMQQQGQSGAPSGYGQPTTQSSNPYSDPRQDPKYTSYFTASHAQPPPPSAQSQLIQPSDIYSTGIESIFGEMGLETPGSEYLKNIQAYDPKQQRRMQQDLSRKLPGPVGGAGGFAGSGAAVKKAGEEREMITEQYTSGAEDLRKQYREKIMQDILADMSAGTYQFEDLG